MVSTSRSSVDPKLRVQHVRDRLFRGYCQNSQDYVKVFIRFNQQRDAIYALYQDSIGRLLKPKIVEETLKYYDQFYRTINDPRRAKREIIEDCVKTD